VKVYRVYDKLENRIIKIGKRTNDLYVSLPALQNTLKTYFGSDVWKTRFKILEYDLVLSNKKESD
jgi:hypothetical protein